MRLLETAFSHGKGYVPALEYPGTTPLLPGCCRLLRPLCPRIGTCAPAAAGLCRWTKGLRTWQMSCTCCWDSTGSFNALIRCRMARPSCPTSSTLTADMGSDRAEAAWEPVSSRTLYTVIGCWSALRSSKAACQMQVVRLQGRVGLTADLVHEFEG